MFISIHTLHTEGDPEGSIERASDDEFQSTPSTRRVTPTSRSDTWFPSFQSTPSTRRVTALPDQHICPHLISIHTLHTEGDFGLKAEFSAFIIISIHTLHTEGDVEGQQVCRDQVRFQSTPSTRRVTQEQINQRLQIFQFQSTPSTRRVTIPLKDFVVIYRISIHTLHTEGDGKFVEKMPRKTISIHTLHTEGDRKRVG